MPSVKDLYDATANSYLDYAGKPTTPPPGYRDLRIPVESDNNHSAVAYYNDKEGDLIIAHRGSVGIPLISYDWRVTDLKIAFSDSNTPADDDAVRFTERTMRTLRDEGLPVNHVYQTGHSKGGHEAQVASAKLVDQYKGQLPVDCVTFNAPGIRDVNRTPGMDYKHTNLRVEGFIFDDPVSGAGGKPLGHTLDVKSGPTVLLPFQAHTMDSVDVSLRRYPDLAKSEADDLNTAVRATRQVDEVLAIMPQVQERRQQAEKALAREHGAGQAPPVASPETLASDIQVTRATPMSAAEQAEVDRRIDGLAKLENSGGTSYTFYSNAREAIAQNGGDPRKVDWRAVETETIRQSIGENGQSPESVRAVLAERSPGAVTPVQQQSVADRVQMSAMDLQAGYERGRSQPGNDLKSGM
ncbi:Mbeg1-like protein [Tahibacter amnicola]|uniref:DUF2974 domain-containing protein n=1 Tax=Tahibacter amnicola TaxID=2976241 RepID=A0ABY6BH57_9GAMM|nr:Mbeg1-like protein [Tahibacter amnicola]UXI69180.1 DUF2974 domain-containing protein [Tahibacter amnicola]